MIVCLFVCLFVSAYLFTYISVSLQVTTKSLFIKQARSIRIVSLDRIIAWHHSQVMRRVNWHV